MMPPNWTRYTTDDGKDYFHNSLTNETQWEAPVSSTITSEIYKPSDSDLELRDHSSKGFSGGAHEADGETVSLTSAPTGNMTSSGGGASSTTVSRAAASSSTLAGGIGGVISAATSEDSSAMGNMANNLLASAQLLFDVSTDDVVKRLKAALLPFEAAASSAVLAGCPPSEFRQRPDFWGPFWVATTAVLFLAATGNFAVLLETGDHTTFRPDYSLVSVAATMIYGCLIAVPVLTRGALYVSGQEGSTINFKQLICVYGYSLAPAIPVSILCIAPLLWLRWLAVLLGLAISLLFVRMNLWADISVEVPSLKWTLVGLLAGSETLIFAVYRIWFFTSH